MNLQMNPAQLILVSLCALLGVIFIYEIAAPLGEFSVPVIEGHRSAAPPAAPAPFVPPSVDAFSAINDRSLFDAQRRPIAPASTPAQGGASATPPSVVLVGVIIDAQERLALVKTPESPLAISVKLGASIGGWQVSAIEADRIVLHSGSASDEIRLDAGHSNATVPPAPPQQPQ
jgi:type II secretory pathway component PulC